MAEAGTVVVTRVLAEAMRRRDYKSAERVMVELRAEDPLGEELQIWRTQNKPDHRIQSGMFVSLWDSNTAQPVQVLRRVMGVRSMEQYWVEFILEPYNPFPSFPDPKTGLTIYLAVPVKWAKLHHKTKVIHRLKRIGHHLYNTYTKAPAALQHIRQTEVHYWTRNRNQDVDTLPSGHATQHV